jgi:hypothetical protein
MTKAMCADRTLADRSAKLPTVVVVLGKVRAADLLQMVVFGEIGSDQEDGCEGEPGKQSESYHHKLHRWIGRG